MQANYTPSATGSLGVIIPHAFRVIIARDKVPVAVPPTYATTYVTTASFPCVDPDALYATGGAGDFLAVRNPNTFDRFHVLEDRIVNLPVTPIGLSVTTGALVGAKSWDWHFDLHKSKTTFYTNTDVSISTNSLFMIIACDALAAEGGLIGISANLDLTFSDAANV